MDLSFVIFVEVLYGVASLVLISAGLAVVFGMMKVINLAHGEFMMMGGYATITAVGYGVNVFVAMLIIAPLVVGLIGLINDRYLNPDTRLCVWWLSSQRIQFFHYHCVHSSGYHYVRYTTRNTRRIDSTWHNAAL